LGRLVAAAHEQGAGHRYLIQHSAGSGKSNTIAWLAHQLSILHDDNDERVFDSIVIITDRRVLDRQLQNTVRQFEQTIGVVENIDQTSRQLREALEPARRSSSRRCRSSRRSWRTSAGSRAAASRSS